MQGKFLYSSFTVVVIFEKSIYLDVEKFQMSFT